MTYLFFYTSTLLATAASLRVLCLHNAAVDIVAFAHLVIQALESLELIVFFFFKIILSEISFELTYKIWPKFADNWASYPNVLFEHTIPDLVPNVAVIIISESKSIQASQFTKTFYAHEHSRSAHLPKKTAY